MSLIITGLVLLFIMAGIEVYIVRKYPPVGRFLEHHPALTLIFSLLVSIVMGIIYPIAGISAMIGGFGSTLLMQVYYWGARKCRAIVAWKDRVIHRSSLA